VRGDRQPFGRQNFFRDDEFKVDLPTFEGKFDPDIFTEWLLTVDRIFDLRDNMTDDQRIKLVATKLRSYASLWWDKHDWKHARRRN
jgi:hypothetical protein